MPVGEAAPRLGDEGARRAKRWLEATTRVAQAWTNEDTVAAGKLTFDWPYNSSYTFSFDLGGVLKGEPFQNHHFMAESKKYDNARDQGTLYDDWLAKCYVARQSTPALADQLLWITWSPFRASNWAEQVTTGAVKRGLLLPHNSIRAFDTEDPTSAEARIDPGLLADVASRLWILVLSDKQERLVVTKEHRSWIAEREMRESD